MKILFFCIRNRSYSEDALIKSLSKIADVRCVMGVQAKGDWQQRFKFMADNPTLRLDKLIKDEKPDIMMFADVAYYLSPVLDRFREGRCQVDIPKVLISADPWTWINEHIKLVHKTKMDLLLLYFYEGFVEKFRSGKGWVLPRPMPTARPEVRTYNDEYYQSMSPPDPPLPVTCPIKHFPSCVDMSIFKNLGLPRTINVHFSGAIRADVYPLRQKLWWALRNRQNVHVKNTKDHPIQKYAEILNQSKISVFCNTRWNIPVQRWFEIMACGTLAMAPKPFDAEALHLIPDHNFVEINEKNFLQKIKYYRSHDVERRKIAECGYETVMKYHTGKIRAKELLDILTQHLNRAKG